MKETENSYQIANEGRKKHNQEAKKWELLQKYHGKEPKLFYQFDCFANDIESKDFDHDNLFSGVTVELMRGSSVRVLIEQSQARRML